jgi:hypothetical protein
VSVAGIVVKITTCRPGSPEGDRPCYDVKVVAFGVAQKALA